MKRIVQMVLMCLTLTGCGNVEQESFYVEPIPIKPTYNYDTVEIVHEEVEEVETVEVIEEVEPIQPIEFRVTAYCSCPVCCGQWAKNRPKDKNGDEIVVGASGDRLEAGVSSASPLPFGSQIDLGELGTVIVHDRTADWVVDKYGTYIIDIYMDNHDVAKKFGVKYVEGVILEDVR